MVASLYAAYRLSFLLPDTLAAFVRPGVHHPCLHGALLTIERGGLVRVDGQSKERVFDQAARFLRIIARDHPAITIAANLITTERRRDPWQIVIGAGVAFMPGGIEPHVPAVAEA
jgi:hypothetical protein